MNATQEIKVISKHHEETSWKRYITFNYDKKNIKSCCFGTSLTGMNCIGETMKPSC